MTRSEYRRQQGEWKKYEKRNHGRHLKRSLTAIQWEHTLNKARQILSKPQDRWRKLQESNTEVTLSRDRFDMIVKSPCVYCGLYFETKGYGIDKVDCTGIYSNENSVACCGDCNAAKKQLSVNQFIQAMINIFVQQNLGETMDLQQQYSQLNSIPNTWQAIQNQCRQFGKTFSLTFEQFTTMRHEACYYCGYNLSDVGLDRIDSDYKSYCVENVVPACVTCNIAKQSLSQSQFYSIVKRIVGNWGSKVQDPNLSRQVIDTMEDADFHHEAELQPKKKAKRYRK